MSDVQPTAAETTKKFAVAKTVAKKYAVRVGVAALAVAATAAVVIKVTEKRDEILEAGEQAKTELKDALSE